MTVEQVKEIALQVYREQEAKKHEELRKSDDYLKLLNDISQIMRNGGDNVPIDIIKFHIDHTTLVKLLSRGYHKEHPNWPGERSTLIQGIKSGMRGL